MTTDLDKEGWYSVWVIMKNDEEGIRRIIDSYEKKYNRKTQVVLCHKENLKNLTEWLPDIEVKERTGVTAFQLWVN